MFFRVVLGVTPPRPACRQYPAGGPRPDRSSAAKIDDLREKFRETWRMGSPTTFYSSYLVQNANYFPTGPTTAHDRPVDVATGRDSPRQARPRQAHRRTKKVNERSLFILAHHTQVTTHPGACMNSPSPDAPERHRIHARPRGYSSMVRPWKAVERPREGPEMRAGRESESAGDVRQRGAAACD